jgi:phosphatidylserine/phosphatidylglycerophosphate/cardiolipin synthase-like enzyme
LDPALQYTYLSQESFQTEFPDRFLLLEMRSTGLAWDEGVFWNEAIFYNEPIFLHSKLRIIDDKYLSVGSCNMNNRGYKYEGEMNITVWDDNFVEEVRERVLAHYVGAEFQSYLSNNSQNNFDLLQMVSEENQIRAEWWDENDFYFNEEADAWNEWALSAPSGFIYPLSFSDTYLDIDNPDLF